MSKFIDKDYTMVDHFSRENDPYAGFKYELSLNKFLALGITKSEKILNVGCGAADFNLYALKKGFSSDGFDADSDSLKIAKQRLPKNAQIINCGIENAKDYFGKYKYLVCHDVIEHIEHDITAVRDIKDNLVDDGGFIIFSVPAHNWLFGLHDEKLGHFRRYNKKTLTEVLNPHFKIIDMHYVGLIGVPIVFIFSKILRKSYPNKKSKLAETIVNLFFKIEKSLGFPYGSSLITLVKKD